MKHLLILAAVSASLLTSACVTVIDADDDDMAWHAENAAKPFDAARDECRAMARHGRHTDFFNDCMAARGWTRS